MKLLSEKGVTGQKVKKWKKGLSLTLSIVHVGGEGDVLDLAATRLNSIVETLNLRRAAEEVVG